MIDTKITLKKVFGHLKTILVHKWWVFYYSCKLGIPWRGIKHDMSKFSPVEFWESVRYWDGKQSPIPICKVDKGYSLAWQHHKGRNSHHYAYWTDNYDIGTTTIKMPWKDLLEMVADWLGAGRAYQGKKFTLEGEYEYVREKVRSAKMNYDTAIFVEYLFRRFAWNPDTLKHFRKDKSFFKEVYEEGRDL